MIASHEPSAWASAAIKSNLEMERIGDYAESIARLLPLKPRVILMDKPCSALDTRAINAVEELSAGLRNGYTIIIVTHNMAKARRVSDECISMLLGEMIEHACIAQISTPPIKESKTSDYIEERYG